MNRFSIVLLSAIAVAFSSCEEDNVDVYSEGEIVEGNKVLASIIETAFSDNDKSKIETSEENVFYYTVDDQSDADAFVDVVTCGEYVDNPHTYVLPAGFGRVAVSPSLEEGDYYYLVDFDIVGYNGIRYILISDADSVGSTPTASSCR